MKLFDLLRKRHSEYKIEKTSSLSDDEVAELVKTAMVLTPSSMNSQSQRVVVLFGEKNEAFWNLTLEELRKVAPEKGFEKTVAKIEEFKGQGTVLFYSDTKVTQKLEEKYPLYASNFPGWAVQENAMLQIVIWTALAEANIGASLQHYNPVIDEAVVNAFGIDPSWKLVAQMPFGGAEFNNKPKEKLSTDTTVIIQK